MSEKFKYLHQDGDYPKVTDGESVWCFAFSIDGQTICDLLNELYGEIEQLARENIQLTCDNKELGCTNIGLYKANEQLKSEITMLKTTIDRNEAYIKRLTNKSKWSN